MKLLLPLLGLACFTGCSWSGKDEEEPRKEESQPRLVGRIASVPEGSGFVLIESYGPWRVPDGGMLSGIGNEGRSSNLVVTGEKLGQFSAADIRSGVAKVGDAVYFRPVKEQDDPVEGVVHPAGGASEAEIETKPDTGES